MEDCIFCKIVQGKIPSRKAYEDDLVYAFHDIHPVAPVHLLIIPKEHIVSMSDLEARHEPAMGRLMVVARRLAQEAGAPEGFRAIVNTGRVGRQEVMHMHMHVIGGKDVLPPMLVRI